MDLMFGVCLILFFRADMILFFKCENSTGVYKKYIIKEFYLKGGMQISAVRVQAESF